MKQKLIEAAADLIAAAEKAETELERLTGDQGFEPDRFRQRMNALMDLARARLRLSRLLEGYRYAPEPTEELEVERRR